LNSSTKPWHPERAAGLAAAALLGTASAASAYGPGATAAEAVEGSLRAMFSGGSFLALTLAGLWLGLLPAAPRGRTLLAVVAALAAGTLLGWAWQPPAFLDALIAGSGLVIALLVLTGRGRSSASAPLPAALVVALFGIGLGGTLRLDAAPAAYVTAFVGTYLLSCVLLLVAGVGTGLFLRRRGSPRLPSLIGIWAGTVSALLLVLGLVPKTPAIDPGTIDLRVGAAPLDETGLRTLVEGLLARIYLAFEETSEEGVFDALAAVTDGDALIELYLQRRQALELEAAGGGSAELTAIRLDALTEEGPPGGPEHRVHGRWEVVGSFGHWGHVHERANRYEADLVLTPVDGTWRITAFELRDMVRIGTTPDAAP
jgi:hypothetical protein